MRIFLSICLLAALAIPASANPLMLLGGSGPYKYYKSHSIAGSSDGAVTDYQVSISLQYGAGSDTGNTVYLNSRCNSDFGDIRFYASDQTTELSYWIETKTDGDNATAWVKIPSIPESPETTTIYIYYGDPGLASASNGTATFTVFSDGQNFTPDINPATQLSLPSPYSPAHYVHPSVVDMAQYGFTSPNWWNGYRYWMANTPYADASDASENPCILVSNDKSTWVIPPSGSNPVIAYPGDTYNSDNELVYNQAANVLMLYWRVGTENGLHAGKTSDGVTWTDLEGGEISDGHDGTSITLSDTSGDVALSPSIIIDGSTWHMWTVGNASSPRKVIHFTSNDGITFSNPQYVTGLSAVPWHMDVIKIGEAYWLATSDNTAPTTAKGGSVWLAQSSDGVAWTQSTVPLIFAGKYGKWDSAFLYRPTMVYSSDGIVDIYYSAFSSATANFTGLASFNLTSTWSKIYTNAMSGYLITGSENANYQRLISSGDYTRNGNNSLFWISNYSGAASPRFYLPVSNATSGRFVSYMYDINSARSANLTISRLFGSVPTTYRMGGGYYGGASTTKYSTHNKSFTYAATDINRSSGWHKYEYLLSGTDVKVYIDGSLAATIASADSVSDVSQISLQAAAANGVGYQYGIFSDAFYANYTVNEPAHGAWGSETRVNR